MNSKEGPEKPNGDVI